MNSGSAPERRLISRISRRISGVTLGLPARQRSPAPEGAKACPMPTDNGFRLYDREDVKNTRRDPIQADGRSYDRSY
jgi:hypothetical protein